MARRPEVLSGIFMTFTPPGDRNKKAPEYPRLKFLAQKNLRNAG
jgi:hypothetical protein